MNTQARRPEGKGVTMEKQKMDWRRVLIVGGAGIAFSIGSGFATGQEVLEYFTSYGMLFGTLAVVLFAVLNIYVNFRFVEAGRVCNTDDGSAVFKFFCGKYIGTFFDWFAVVFTLMSFWVMIAGAGATLNQQFGIPKTVGSVLIAVLAGITVMFGLKRMNEIIGRIGPVIIVFAIIAGIVGVFAGDTGVAKGNELVTSGAVEVLRAGNHWWSAAFSYLGFGMMWFAAFFAAFGKNEKNVRDANGGVVVHSVMLAVAVIVVSLALLSNIELIVAEGEQIPLLKVLDHVSPALSTVFSIIIFLGIYSTACPLLWTPVNRLAKEGTNKYRIIAGVLTISACLIGLVFEFNTLVNWIYVINGYVGFAMIFFIIAQHIYSVAKKNKGEAANE